MQLHGRRRKPSGSRTIDLLRWHNYCGRRRALLGGERVQVTLVLAQEGIVELLLPARELARHFAHVVNHEGAMLEVEGRQTFPP